MSKTPDEKLEIVEEDRLGDCRRCRLCEGRNSIVFGEGSAETDLVLVGEGPGRKEDETGRPFVGRSGQLLTRVLDRSSLSRGEVYITNIVKCRPPGNRNPKDDEIESCLPFLRAQIKIIQPESIVSIGKPATHQMTGKDGPLGKLRSSSPHPYSHEDDLDHEVSVFPVYHPAYVLRQSTEQARHRTAEMVDQIERAV